VRLGKSRNLSPARCCWSYWFYLRGTVLVLEQLGPIPVECWKRPEEKGTG